MFGNDADDSEGNIVGSNRSRSTFSNLIRDEHSQRLEKIALNQALFNSFPPTT